MNADFSRTLALLRQEKGISQRKAAKELGISQALLSHYENGIREPGLAFVKKACDYYHVSADYLLGRTLDRDGGMIDAESLYDSSDEKGSLRGSIAATLQKKMLVNTAGVLFELLGKTNDRTLITSAGSYLGGAFYQLYRALHRASGGKEGYFGLDATAYQSGAVDAQMRADYIAYASSLAQLSEKDGAFVSLPRPHAERDAGFTQHRRKDQFPARQEIRISPAAKRLDAPFGARHRLADNKQEQQL